MDVIHRLQLNTTVIKKENSSQASKGIKHDIKKTSCKIDDDREAGDGKRGRRYLPPLHVLQTLFGQAAAASYADTYENYLAPAQK